MRYSLLVCLLALGFVNSLPTEQAQQQLKAKSSTQGNIGQYINADLGAESVYASSEEFKKRHFENEQETEQQDSAQTESLGTEEPFFNAEQSDSSEQGSKDNLEEGQLTIENYKSEDAPFNSGSFKGKEGPGSINEIEWPDAWCEKECRETFLLYEGCKKQGELVGESCVCSVHFRYKVNKCQADGCQHYYNRQPEWQQLMERYLEECKDKGTDFVNY